MPEANQDSKLKSEPEERGPYKFRQHQSIIKAHQDMSNPSIHCLCSTNPHRCSLQAAGLPPLHGLHGLCSSSRLRRKHKPRFYILVQRCPSPSVVICCPMLSSSSAHHKPQIGVHPQCRKWISPRSQHRHRRPGVEDQ